MKKTMLLAAALSLALTGCMSTVQEIGKDPSLTPVGAGLQAEKVSIVVAPTQKPIYSSGNSLWQDSASDLFRDARAMRVGDVVTVKISIKDKASIDNETSRSRQSTSDQTYTMGYTLDNTALKSSHIKTAGDGSLKSTGAGDTSTQGKGQITRSESIDLLIAAVVTDVLPNGNLMISGKQEVRVNSEIRELSVAGVVRPRDISTENSISYEKIAEARISYGGRGRITEVQQPGWGQQLWDKFSPY